MAFEKKTWVNRQVQYPGRRKLTATGTTDTYDVTREEGLVTLEGNAFSADEMNDLENRVETGLGEKAALAHKTRHASGGADALTPSDIGAATTATYTATLTAAGWSGSGPYTQTVSVSGILADDTPIVDVVLSDTAATAQAQLEAWGMVGRIKTAANQITATCYEDKPAAGIPIQMKVVR